MAELAATPSSGEIRDLDHDVAVHGEDDAIRVGRLRVGEDLLGADHLALDLVVGVTGQGVAYEVNERHAVTLRIAATARTKMKVRRARIENL